MKQASIQWKTGLLQGLLLFRCWKEQFEYAVIKAGLLPVARPLQLLMTIAQQELEASYWHWN